MPSTPAARLTVGGVIGVRAWPQMRRVAAGRVVAIVEHEFAGLQCPAVRQLPDNAGKDSLTATVNGEQSVPVFVPGTAAFPALIWTTFVYQRPGAVSLRKFPRPIGTRLRAVRSAFGLHAVNGATADGTLANHALRRGKAPARVRAVQPTALQQLLHFGAKVFAAEAAGSGSGIAGHGSAHRTKREDRIVTHCDLLSRGATLPAAHNGAGAFARQFYHAGAAA